MTITKTTTVADIARELPSSIPVLQRHGIDFCCGGKLPIGAVCEAQALDFVEISKAIEAAAASPAEEADWSAQPLTALIDHILTTYHQPLHEDLPRLEAMAFKVAEVHGAKASELARIEALVSELAADLQVHMRKEEMILFPAIRALEAGARTLPIPISAPIAVMEHDHDDAGRLLGDLRSLTNDYQVPQWACATTRTLYDGLAKLESAMHVHVHLENNILFPRAIALGEGGVEG